MASDFPKGYDFRGSSNIKLEDDLFKGLKKSVTNNQSRYALEYLLVIVGDLQARVMHLESKLDNKTEVGETVSSNPPTEAVSRQVKTEPEAEKPKTKPAARKTAEAESTEQ
jgi:hypothetical protein